MALGGLQRILPQTGGTKTGEEAGNVPVLQGSLQLNEQAQGVQPRDSWCVGAVIAIHEVPESEIRLPA